jgi:hypothetical protein
MSKLIAILFACLLSVGVSAQDLKLSFGGTTLSSRGTNITNSSKLLKDSRLIAETPGFKVISYVISFLPKQGDLVGPFTIIAEQNNPQQIKMFLDRSVGSKIYLDDIKVQGPDGKVKMTTNYVVACQ